MRQYAILALLPLLAGCGLPPAVAIASYALDGALLAATGKTSKDHALSAAVQQDCSMFRIVTGGELCQDYEPSDQAARALAAMGPGEEQLTTTSDGRVIRVAAQPVVPQNENFGLIASSVDETGPVSANVGELPGQLD